MPWKTSSLLIPFEFQERAASYGTSLTFLYAFSCMTLIWEWGEYDGTPRQASLTKNFANPHTRWFPECWYWPARHFVTFLGTVNLGEAIIWITVSRLLSLTCFRHLRIEQLKFWTWRVLQCTKQRNNFCEGSAFERYSDLGFLESHIHPGQCR
jgi:hypothetical protein